MLDSLRCSYLGWPRGWWHLHEYKDIHNVIKFLIHISNTSCHIMFKPCTLHSCCSSLGIHNQQNVRFLFPHLKYKEWYKTKCDFLMDTWTGWAAHYWSNPPGTCSQSTDRSPIQFIPATLFPMEMSGWLSSIVPIKTQFLFFLPLKKQFKCSIELGALIVLCNKYTNYFNLFKLEVIAEPRVLNDIIWLNRCGLQALNDNNSIGGWH